jgi:hypothetical protein
MAGFQAVDIAVDKRIRVQRLDGQHGLLHRTAVAVLRGDFPQGIAGVVVYWAGLLTVGAGRGGQTRRGAADGGRADESNLDGSSNTL